MVTTILEPLDPTGKIDPARHVRKWDAVPIGHRKAQPYSVKLFDDDEPRPDPEPRHSPVIETIL